MSALGLKSGYTVKEGLSPWDCRQAIPRAQTIFYHPMIHNEACRSAREGSLLCCAAVGQIIEENTKQNNDRVFIS